MKTITKTVFDIVRSNSCIERIYLILVDDLHKSNAGKYMTNHQFSIAVFTSLAAAMNGNLIYPDDPEFYSDASTVQRSKVYQIEFDESDLTLLLLSIE